MLELLEVGFGEIVELLVANVGQGDADGAVVRAVWPAGHESGAHGTVDQSDGAVVAQYEVVRDITDRWPGRIWVSFDCEQQLVLRGCDAGGSGLMLAPVQKAPEAGAEREQALEIGSDQ